MGTSRLALRLPPEVLDMISFHTAKPLSFPVQFPDVPACLVYCSVSREMANIRLGPPILTDWVDGLGKADFWAFEYPCGLQVAFEFLHESTGGRILADSPEIEHVLRHIPFSESECARIDEIALQSELKLLLSGYPDRRDEIDSLHSFQVWRQGDDGNSFKIGDPTSERDAKCRVQQFESLAHKQLYWYSKISSNSGKNDIRTEAPRL